MANVNQNPSGKQLVVEEFGYDYRVFCSTINVCRAFYSSLLTLGYKTIKDDEICCSHKIRELTYPKACMTNPPLSSHRYTELFLLLLLLLYCLFAKD